MWLQAEGTAGAKVLGRETGVFEKEDEHGSSMVGRWGDDEDGSRETGRDGGLGFVPQAWRAFESVMHGGEVMQSALV